MKITVVHHSADYDGIFCREIAKQFLGSSAEYIGWDYGNPLLPFPEGQVYVMDLSPECFISPLPDINEVGRRLIWIDHHKSAIDQWPEGLPGYRIEGVSACRLAWQWFFYNLRNSNLWQGPTKSDFAMRNVNEPLAVRLAGEYDVWDHRGDGDLEFQFGLDAMQDLDFKKLLASGTESELYVADIVGAGTDAMNCLRKREGDIMKTRSFVSKFAGLNVLCLNTARCNSQTFAAKDVPETGHDALLAFYFNGKSWFVSLYHAAHRTELDLSIIAKRYGGGGHRGACGFRSDVFPIPVVS
jgi:hypothetical protein